MADLRDLIDRFDRLVATSRGIVPDAVLERAARVGRHARDRRGFLGDTVVVALAGGTGSGKSSLINALAGEVVTEAGAQRPTTHRPLAWIPADPEPGLVRLLDAIGVSDWVGQDTVPWLALIDLPDTDSVSEANRATVERVLPLVDAVVWVVDPEKYQDRVLHERYLRPLARHGSRFRFVLNQIDRIDPEEVDTVIEDFAASLETDGVIAPVVLPMAVDPPLGQPAGLDDFLEAMATLGDAKAVVEAKTVTDLERAALELMEAAGLSGLGGTGFREDWDRVKAEAADDIAADLIGPATIEEARRAGARSARLAASIRSEPPAEVDVPVRPGAGGGTRRAIDRVDRLLGELAERVGTAHAGEIRDVRRDLEREISSAAAAVGSAAAIRLGPPPGRWERAGWLRLVATVVAAVGAWALAGVNGLVEPIPIVVGALAAVMVFVLAGALIARSGRRWAGERASDADRQLIDAISRELDRRIGRPTRDALRTRAGVAAAHAEFELIRSTLDRR